MRSSHSQRSSSSNNALQFQQIEELLRFTKSLNTHSDPKHLLMSLSAELRSLIHADIITLLHLDDADFGWHAISNKGTVPYPDSMMDLCREEIGQLFSNPTKTVLLTPSEGRIPFPNLSRFFEKHGDRSLYIAPLVAAHQQLGLLCFIPEDPDAEIEPGLFPLIANYVALAIENHMNYVHRVSAQAQLENERTKLNLFFDLNESVVSHLELREVLRSVSPSIRKAMRLDGVALILPDATNTQLQLYALDFPDGKDLHEGMTRVRNNSLASQVFRSGKPWVGDIEELIRSGFDGQEISRNGVETICMLPLTRCNSVLGVLGVVRLHKNAFTASDIEFLSQIAGQVAIAIDNAFAYRRITELSDKLTQEKLYLEDEIRNELNFEEIIGSSPVLRQVLHRVEAVAPTSSTVLIQGETGSGKELIARAVHNLSQRRTHPFVKLNCAAIPTGLLESELFGHEKGAFTGAIAQRIGRFELTSQGTIFLDEISEIPLDLQPKLLRVLQEREFERLGSSRTLRTDARLIAATNRDLSAMVEEQRFRSDLFYRLNVFPIYVPPLRERKEDIPFLVRHFAQHFARNMSKQIDTISAETMNALVRYPWPGNIRELQNIIERAVILSKGPTLKVSLDDLKLKGVDANGFANGMGTLEEIERKHILTVLEKTNWVFAGPNGAAAQLGIKRPTLQFRMRKLGISRPTSSQSPRIQN